MIESNDGVKYAMSELFTVESVMKTFDVTRMTVYNWLGKKSSTGGYPDGKFPHSFKLGKIYIPIVDVQEYIQNRCNVGGVLIGQKEKGTRKGRSS